jgi:hypothetical protein
LTPLIPDEKAVSYINTLSAYYKPESIKKRAKMVSYILDATDLRYEDLARLVGVSTSHIFQLNFLAKKLTDDELRAIDDIGIGVFTAYQKFKFGR